jgi:hemerythrin superfamily protein
MANPIDQLMSKGAGKVNEIKARSHGLVGVFAVLAEQHGEAGSLLKRLKADPSKRGALWPTIRTALMAHEQGELREVYPALRMYDELTGFCARHDAEASELSATIEQIDALAPDSTRFPSLLDTLIGLVEAHVAEEEGRIFPKAVEVLGAARSKELQPKFEMAAKQVKQQQQRQTFH